jgi:hypothetical protein
MMSHQTAAGCYYRLVERDASIVGWFGPRGVDCPHIHPLVNGFITTPVTGRFADMEDVSVPPLHSAVRLGEGRDKLRVEDSYLGLCYTLIPDEAKGPVPSNRWAARGCAYTPHTHTLSTVEPGYLIDAAGRYWFEGSQSEGEHIIKVTDGDRTWAAPPFPNYPSPVVATANGSAAAAIKGHWHRLYVSSDAGATWAAVRGPKGDPQIEGMAMLPDGRLVLGPVGGEMWRGRDSRNLELDPLPTGPIKRIYAAGNILYGRATRDFVHGLRGVVWMSTNAGDTWRQVLSVAGATPRTKAVPALDLPDPVVTPKS